jgi:RNA polymerase sigma-70 factor (ECF subfamily)
MMDAQQLARLLDEYAAALTLYARQWCTVPEDVVQEAFVKLAALPRPPDSPGAWLHRVVRNGALSAARADRRRRHHETAAAEQTPAWFLPSEVSPLDAQAVAAALESLPGEQRETIVAHLWGGLSFEQIGTLTGTSASTAHRHYRAALAGLRTRLRIPCPKET